MAAVERMGNLCVPTGLGAHREGCAHEVEQRERDAREDLV